MCSTAGRTPGYQVFDYTCVQCYAVYKSAAQFSQIFFLAAVEEDDGDAGGNSSIYNIQYSNKNK